MQAVRTNGFLPQKPENCTTGMRGWRNWQTRTFEVRVVYPWGFESPPSHKRKTHGLAIDRGFFLCFPTKAANKTAGPDSIQGPELGAIFYAGEGGRTLTPLELVPKTSASAIPPLLHGELI